MKDQPVETPKPQEGISGWLNATANLASLVVEEQRPQLIVLVLIYIAFLILIPFLSHPGIFAFQKDLVVGLELLAFS